VPRGAAMHTTHSPRPAHPPPSAGSAPHSRSSSASACPRRRSPQPWVGVAWCARVRACATEHAHLSKRRPPAAVGAHAPRRQRPEAPRRLAPPRQRGPARQRVRRRLGLARQAGPHARVEVGGPLRGVDGGRAGEELEQDDAEGEDVRRRRVLACPTPCVSSSALPQTVPRPSAPQPSLPPSSDSHSLCLSLPPPSRPRKQARPRPDVALRASQVLLVLTAGVQ
jgi:hypothetical protein